MKKYFIIIIIAALQGCSALGVDCQIQDPVTTIGNQHATQTKNEKEQEQEIILEDSIKNPPQEYPK